MWTVILALFVIDVAATPQIAFPFNSQVPPVARTAQPYLFQLADTTFSDSSSDITYALVDAPAWLQLVSDNRTLYGTPSSQDVGSPVFGIQATDSTGSINSNCTLVVSADKGPTVAQNLSIQMQAEGRLSAPATWPVYPGAAFNLSFSSTTFTAGQLPILTYYATLSDHTPLPSWIQFDAASLSFNGTADAIAGEESDTDILIIATDVIGFAGVEQQLTIRVAEHLLDFEEQQQTHVVTAGRTFTQDLASQLYLDSNLSTSADIANATLSGISWLSVNQTSLQVSGQIPSDFEQDEVILTVQDTYGDYAQKSMILQAADSSSNTSQGGIGSGGTQGGAATEDDHLSPSRGAVAGAIVGSIAGALILVLLLWLLCVRRKRRNRKLQKSDISRPILGEKGIVYHYKVVTDDGNHSLVELTAAPYSPPPKLHLSLFNSPRKNRRGSHASMNRSSALPPIPEKSHGRKPSKVALLPPHRKRFSTLGLEMSTGPEKQTTADVDAPSDPAEADDMPRPLTSHARGASAATRNFSRNFARPTSQSTLSLQRFAMENRRSIRLVSVSPSQHDPRTLEEKRQSFIRARASSATPSPLFGHDSSALARSAAARRPQAPANNMAAFARQIRRSSSSSTVAPRSWRRARPPADAPLPSVERDPSPLDHCSSIYSSGASDCDSGDEWEAQLALPRDQRPFVLPGEASPTPPPPPHHREGVVDVQAHTPPPAGFENRETTRRRWKDRLGRNSRGQLVAEPLGRAGEEITEVIAPLGKRAPLGVIREGRNAVVGRAGERKEGLFAAGRKENAVLTHSSSGSGRVFI